MVVESSNTSSGKERVTINPVVMVVYQAHERVSWVSIRLYVEYWCLRDIEQAFFRCTDATNTDIDFMDTIDIGRGG